MNKQKLLLPISLLLLFLPLKSVFADNATSTDATSAPTTLLSASTTPTNQLTLPQAPLIINQINSAKDQLATIKLNYDISPVYKKNKKGKSVISTYTLNAKDLAIAILDPSDGSIKVTTGIQKGKSVIFPDKNFDVQLTRFNGVNSSFLINKPAGGSVLALKYLITGPEKGSQKTITSALSESIYVPYSDALSSPEVIAYGKSYLDGVITEVVKELKYIPSQAIPGQTLTDVIPPATIKALIYAEHTDTSAVMSGNAKSALDKLNILFATNLGDTYKYSVSNDGYASRGISQFIKSTYDSLVVRHPEAGLIPEYISAMADHVNSVKAMYLLLDDYAGDIRVKAPSGFIAARVFDYGAASYNAGVTHVANAVEEFGDNWNQDRTGQISSLQGQISSTKYQITSLKSKIKKTADKKIKATFQAQLASAQSNLNSAQNQVADLLTASLRGTTINYLQKIYRVISFLNQDQQNI